MGPPPPAAAAVAITAASPATVDVQQAYDRYAATYDELDAGNAASALGFPELREQLVSQASGRVLEVAVGTGLNLPYYRWSGDSGDASASGSAGAGAGVASLTAIDLSSGMLGQAARRAEGALPGRPVSFDQADVTALPFPDGSFDSVVDTFSLCVFPDPAAALKEVARVVRPAGAGRVLLLEHARSDNALLAAYQDATASGVAALSKGCVWNQDVEALVRGAGLSIVRAERSGPGGTIELLEAVRPS